MVILIQVCNEKSKWYTHACTRAHTHIKGSVNRPRTPGNATLELRSVLKEIKRLLIGVGIQGRMSSEQDPPC